MGAVFTIAWRDMRSFVSSVKGGVIFAFFLGFMGMFLNAFINLVAKHYQQAAMQGGQPPGLDQLMRALFYNVCFILLLFIPAVTMSAFAEEKKTHTIRLLQTAPIHSWQIVLGKFTAAFGFLALVFIASAVHPLYVIYYGNPDIGPILTSYLGIFLLMSAQVAFGLWVSSMTAHQFTAFLLTMTGLFALFVLQYFASSIAGGGVLESLLKYLATTEHLEVFFKGMLTVKSVGYFLAFTALFLFFANAAVDSQRWR